MGGLLDPVFMLLNLVRIFGSVSAMAFVAGTASAAPSRVEAKTHLAHCGQDTCLFVTGRRNTLATTVSLAGHAVEVAGGRRWRVAVPLDTVRAWSAPASRTISVRLGGMNEAEASVPLPTGLLGQRTELAFLDVRAR